MERTWSRTAVVYRICTRSFADSDGDGIGDLPGVITHLDHVAALGAQAVQVCADSADSAGRLAEHCRAHGLEVVEHAEPFDLVELGWSGPQWLDTVTEHLAKAEASGAACGWTISGHDVVRPVTRLGLAENPAPDLGYRRAMAVTLLMLALPGSAYLYMGDELGLTDSRAPMPWSSEGPSLGFSEVEGWMPQPPEYAALSVERQTKNPTSTLNLCRAALKVRRAFAAEEQVDVGFEDGLFWVARESGWVSATNFGAKPVDVPVEQVFMSTVPLLYGQLPSDATVWLHP